MGWKLTNRGKLKYMYNDLNVLDKFDWLSILCLNYKTILLTLQCIYIQVSLAHCITKIFFWNNDFSVLNRNDNMTNFNRV